MIEYRKLKKGEERISTLGLGMGGMQSAPPEEIEAVIKKAVQNGINFFDLCAGEPRFTSPSERLSPTVGTKFIFSSISAPFKMTRANTAGQESCPRFKRPLNGSLKLLKPTMSTSDFCIAWTARATSTT